MLGMAVLIFLGSCASTNQSAERDSTVAKDPHRDSDLARKQTDQATALIDQGKWTEAETSLHQALDADVMYGPAHNNLGTVYLHQNNLYSAAWEFQYAAKLMPYSPQPRSNLGLVLEQAGKLDEAIDSYEQAVKIEPDNPQFVGNDARARIRRGDRDQKVRELLAKLSLIDTRPDWAQWARERLVLLGSTPAPSSTQPQEQP